MIDYHPHARVPGYSGRTGPRWLAPNKTRAILPEVDPKRALGGKGDSWAPCQRRFPARWENNRDEAPKETKDLPFRS